ncbi:MAG: hypothetical protein M3443_08115 [Actinomycetota bacterium]|nr:hypothetical protein [Actinomycetota bacterium]
MTVMEWTIEAVRAEVGYRRDGTRDCTSRLHLRDIERTIPAWWQRLGRHRPTDRVEVRHTA